MLQRKSKNPRIYIYKVTKRRIINLASIENRYTLIIINESQLFINATAI